jgi:hypothetical protein
LSKFGYIIDSGRKIEIVDDSGNEISEIDIPIPFYIRVKMGEGMIRYKVKLIDDSGNLRGQYIGTTDNKFLELHVPLIKLPKLGKIRVLVEESSIDSQISQQHSISLLYIDYKPKNLFEEDSERLNFSPSGEEVDLIENITSTKEEEKELPESSSNIQSLFTITRKEIQYLTHGEQELGENQDSDVYHRYSEEE